MTKHDDLTGMVIVITGGARGIGAATAERLARAGARVALGDRDEAVARELAAELTKTTGSTVVAGALDVASTSSWAAFLSAVSDLGPVDVLINNAGIMPLGEVVKEPDEVARRILDVNVHGVINGTKAVVPGMTERGHGHIINVASAVGRVAVANGATYSASKFAVVGFSEATRAELAPAGIEVCLVLPTVVTTDLAAGVPAARGVKKVSAEDCAKVIEDVIRRPVPEAWVPRWTRGMVRATSMLPRRVGEAISKAMHADKVLSEVDEAARAAYEDRARH
jgi:short-subunit dehydrogenase